MGLQLAQGGGDTRRALREAGRERLDVGAGSGGQRLDVAADTDRQEGELRVLREVVADHREAGGVAGVLVCEAGGARSGGARVVSGAAGRPCVGLTAANGGPGGRGHAKVLGVHREALFFLGGQALASGLQSRRGPSHVCCCCAYWG